MMQRIEIVFDMGSQNSEIIWQRIAKLLRNMKTDNKLTFYEKETNLKELTAIIAKEKSFNIKSNNYSFHMVTVTNSKHILLQIETKQCSSNWWVSWINEFIQLNGFIQAWLVDSEFDYWQNANDPIEYSSAGKSFDGLPMISNGLPPPLEQLNIDTSMNAGLRKLCDGYVEAIGAKMWLSDIFLNNIGKDIESIAKNSGANIKKLKNGVVELSMTTDLFVDETSIKEQKKLRNALYGE